MSLRVNIKILDAQRPPIKVEIKKSSVLSELKDILLEYLQTQSQSGSSIRFFQDDQRKTMYPLYKNLDEVGFTGENLFAQVYSLDQNVHQIYVKLLKDNKKLNQIMVHLSRTINQILDTFKLDRGQDLHNFGVAIFSIDGREKIIRREEFSSTLKDLGITDDVEIIIFSKQQFNRQITLQEPEISNQIEQEQDTLLKLTFITDDQRIIKKFPSSFTFKQIRDELIEILCFADSDFPYEFFADPTRKEKYPQDKNIKSLGISEDTTVYVQTKKLSQLPPTIQQKNYQRFRIEGKHFNHPLILNIDPVLNIKYLSDMIINMLGWDPEKYYLKLFKDSLQRNSYSSDQQLNQIPQAQIITLWAQRRKVSNRCFKLNISLNQLITKIQQSFQQLSAFDDQLQIVISQNKLDQLQGQLKQMGITFDPINIISDDDDDVS